MSDKIVGLDEIWVQYFQTQAGADSEEGDGRANVDPTENMMGMKNITRSSGDSTDLNELAHFYQVDPKVLSLEQARALFPILFRNGLDEHLLSRGKELYVLNDCMFYFFPQINFANLF